MSTTFRVPDPPVPPPDPHLVKANLDRGRCAGCCVCNQLCYTWWSATPPSGYAPVHERCVEQLVGRWKAMLTGGVPATGSVAPPRERVGAYARLASATSKAADVPAVTLTGQKAAVLPDGFRPGAFWLPGDTADTPWTMLAVTSAGVMATPCSTRERAHQEATRLSLLRETSERIPVVGAVVVAPDGTWSHCWGRTGDAPDRLESRENGQQSFGLWQTVTRMSEWWTCAGCQETRWPGTWTELMSLRCLDCLAEGEVDDPRPALIEPSYPGDQYLPEWFTKPARKLGLPKGYGRRRR